MLKLGLLFLIGAAAIGCGGSTGNDDVATGGQAQTERPSQMEAACGGGRWEDVGDSFAGLEGSYGLTNAVTESDALASITFSGMTTSFRSNGSYDRVLRDGTHDSGAFEALPDNAAFETAITITPTGSGPLMYYVLGVRRAETGEIAALCLEKMLDARTAEAVTILERAAPK